MTWTLTYPAKPWSSNQERNMHWGKKAALIKEWRDAFHISARAAKVPPLGRIGVGVSVETRTARLPDTGACWPAVKAAIDGLVDGKVITNDTGAEVLWITLYPPAKTGRDALTLTVTALPLAEAPL